MEKIIRSHGRALRNAALPHYLSKNRNNKAFTFLHRYINAPPNSQLRKKLNICRNLMFDPISQLLASQEA
jgi:hypothetical protein